MAPLSVRLIPSCRLTDRPTDRPKERTSFARSVGQTSSVHPTTVLAHAIGDDASLLSHTEEVEDTARVAVNGFLPLNALLRRLLVTSFAPYVWPSTTWCVCEVPPALLYKTRHLCRPREQKMKLA